MQKLEEMGQPNIKKQNKGGEGGKENEIQMAEVAQKAGVSTVPMQTGIRTPQISMTLESQLQEADCWRTVKRTSPRPRKNKEKLNMWR